MKGVAAWIWIVMSVVLALIVIVFGSRLVLDQLSSTQKQVAIENFYDINFKVKYVCDKGGVGELYRYKIALPESVTAIYISNSSDDPPPAKVPVLISKGSMAIGKFFCIKFTEENIPRCEPLSCYVNMTYFGTPSQKSDLASLIARLVEGSPIFKYDILLNKTAQTFIDATAKASIGEKIGESTTSQS